MGDEIVTTLLGQGIFLFFFPLNIVCKNLNSTKKGKTYSTITEFSWGIGPRHQLWGNYAGRMGKICSSQNYVWVTVSDLHKVPITEMTPQRTCVAVFLSQTRQVDSVSLDIFQNNQKTPKA